jgi:hypothetical protein
LPSVKKVVAVASPANGPAYPHLEDFREAETQPLWPWVKKAVEDCLANGLDHPLLAADSPAVATQPP